ncbi:MAG: Ig-like domain-containing protein, partial [Muribaculaceae bacterium]|nr:Ig-like domain-containing protein [Muribaculaceae bacterium]
GVLHYFGDEICNVTTEGTQPPMNDLTLDPIMAKLKPGQTLQINATGADNITWTTSDNSVATVDANGVVTAVKSGLVAITATAASGATAWCAIFVYNPGDVNEDEDINVMDITALIDIIMNS